MREFWRTANASAHLPFIEKAEEILQSFTASGRVLFYFFAGLLVVSSLSLLYLLNISLLIEVPAPGGTLTEGIVGSPRFVNPTLAASDADHDLVALVYSGLLRATPEGSYLPDLAQHYAVSEDGKTYTFTLRDTVTFHDGKPVTAADVAFTINKIQSAALKSPLRANWSGVIVEEVDQRVVRVTLESPYAPFIKNFTLGILPKHLWQDVTDEEFPWSDLNASPIGSGPFKVHSVSRTSSGIPSSYELRPFSNYALHAPYLKRITLNFYESEGDLLEALKAGEVKAASSISPALLAELDGAVTKRASLNRVFAVFFNQNQSEVLRDKDVREALFLSVDRQALVEKVLGGYGTPLEEPVPPSLLQKSSETKDESALAENKVATARESLLSSGWKMNEEGVLQKTTGKGKDAKTLTLSFSLSTGGTPELRAAAEELRNTWQEMGAEVEIKFFESGDLSQNVIRPRKYDALLFGEVVGQELDLYPFWHSSQRNDPGLNVALYANSTADDLLERMRETQSVRERQSLYQELRAEFAKDIPAVFLYAPDFVYIFEDDIQGLSLGLIEEPSDRFLSVLDWHTQKDEVWPFFSSLR